jgi:hypothetical protein
MPLDYSEIDRVPIAPREARNDVHVDCVNRSPLPDVLPLKSNNPFRRLSSHLHQPDVTGPSISLPATGNTTRSPRHTIRKQESERCLEEMMQGFEPHELQDECMIRCPTCGSPSAYGQDKFHTLGSRSCPVQLQSSQPFVQIFHPFISDTFQLPIVSYASPPLYTASPNPCSSCKTFHPPSAYVAQSCAPAVIRYPEISSSYCQRPFDLAYRVTPSYELCRCSIH